MVIKSVKIFLIFLKYRKISASPISLRINCFKCVYKHFFKCSLKRNLKRILNWTNVPPLNNIRLSNDYAVNDERLCWMCLFLDKLRPKLELVSAYLHRKSIFSWRKFNIFFIIFCTFSLFMRFWENTYCTWCWLIEEN